MSYIVPSVLEKTPADVEARLKAIQPHFLRCQIDVLNNTLVEGETYADVDLIGRHIGDMRAEIHLMVDLSSYDVSQWNKEWVRRIIVHRESTEDLRPYIEEIHTMGKNVFVALNPETETSTIKDILADIDGVLFMTVNPGRYGAPFQAAVLDKIKAFHEAYPDVHIEVDGGVTNETLPALLSVGVKGAAVGSYLDNEHIEDRSIELLGILEEKGA